jgi:hypothetical protein
MYKKQSNYHYEEFQLNSDGTTLAQRKIGAATINGMVVSVNELANGSAEQIAKDITKEFKNLREIAQALGLDNADSINWSLVTSSTSDSASSKLFVSLVDLNSLKRFVCSDRVLVFRIIVGTF